MQSHTLLSLRLDLGDGEHALALIRLGLDRRFRLLRLLLLLLLYQLCLYQALYLGRTILRDVSDTLASRADEPFEGQVIACGERIVFVGLDVAPSVLPRSLIKLILV